MAFVKKKDALTERQQLDLFIDRYTPEVAAEGRAVLARMREPLPGATQLVYDNYNGLVVGFGEREKPSEAVFSVVLFPRWVTLFFLQGARIPDPAGLLRGGGNQVRHVRLKQASDLDAPELRALMDMALESAGWSPDASAKGALVIRSVSAKQRPRTPPRASG
ncbi:MAG: DUF1801 domain-containing protein [Bryobacteraceae bacterium]|nr:DUF1801 domain-containing protein [Bryobacteraceae bacterium]